MEISKETIQKIRKSSTRKKQIIDGAFDGRFVSRREEEKRKKMLRESCRNFKQKMKFSEF
jgi:hypothetical protein